MLPTGTFKTEFLLQLIRNPSIRLLSHACIEKKKKPEVKGMKANNFTSTYKLFLHLKLLLVVCRQKPLACDSPLATGT